MKPASELESDRALSLLRAIAFQHPTHRIVSLTFCLKTSVQADINKFLLFLLK
jgi:hypothetical protein